MRSPGRSVTRLPLMRRVSCSSRKEMCKYGIIHSSMELGNTVCAVLVDARVVSGGYDISVYDEVGNWTLVQAPGSIYEKWECTY